MSSPRNLLLCVLIMAMAGQPGFVEGKVEGYIKKMKSFFFTVSKAKNGHKLHALVAGLPADTYLVLRDMCGPEMPSENRYDVLIKLVKYHYDSSSKTILERKIFRLIKRKLEKKIHAYMVRLSRAARGCQFKGNVNKNLVCLGEELITLTLHHAS